MGTRRISQHSFFGVLALLFALSSVVTVALCRSMSDMGGMSMPGGWTMSMAWMQMPDQSWLRAEASFVGMWTAMMAAMMLPSLVPMLLRYRETPGIAAMRRLDLLTTLVGAGYFAVWIVIGIVIFPVGLVVSMAEMQHSDLSRAVPAGVSVLVLVVGALQFTQWKARRLACCRDTSWDFVLPGNAATAWRHGLRIGLQCAYCCFGLMLIVLVMGVMDLRLMAVATAAITAERLAPNGHRVARAIGWLVAAAGLFLIARAVGVFHP